MRFIQGYAVDKLVELVEYIQDTSEGHRDPFVNERRLGQRYPNVVPQLITWTQGYEKNCESALAILEFLERHFDVSEAMAKEIRVFWLAERRQFQNSIYFSCFSFLIVYSQNSVFDNLLDSGVSLFPQPDYKSCQPQHGQDQ